MSIANSGIKVDAAHAGQAIETLNRLAEAAKKAADAINALGELQHGGTITIKIAGPLSIVEIKPKD